MFVLSSMLSYHHVLLYFSFARLHLKASVTVFTNFCWISRPQKFCHISIHDIHWHSRNDLFSFLLPMNCNILSWCLRLEVCLLILLLICNCYFRQVNQNHSADHQPHDGLWLCRCQPGAQTTSSTATGRSPNVCYCS